MRDANKTQTVLRGSAAAFALLLFSVSLGLGWSVLTPSEIRGIASSALLVGLTGQLIRVERKPGESKNRVSLGAPSAYSLLFSLPLGALIVFNGVVAYQHLFNPPAFTAQQSAASASR